MTVKAATDAEINDFLQQFDGWTREDNHLIKTFQFGEYEHGVKFAVDVSKIAQRLNHHPEITLGYRKVAVKLTTHDADDSISSKDFEVAQAVESLATA